ncbi:polysaccharide deacetylase family protein [Paenibacillus hamazuiensis]|uniref:polysaccharide deacetylase family protein n=1 Tax=Paenibacillus hamazuiensis TaxID=2936508 RepID=UPI00201040F3|nr:polysaccharide deacetylase family protein [Paenibacillus hamazuiensis]
MKLKNLLLAAALFSLAGCSQAGQNAAQGGDNTNSGGRGTGSYTAQSAGDNRKLNATETPRLKAGAEQVHRQPQPLSLADLHQKYKSTFLFNGPASLREVALTFDDVPDNEFTPQVLDVLKAYGVRATFFVVGNRAEAHPDIVRRIAAEGHVLGNHSYDHPNLPKMSDDVFHDQVKRTGDILANITGIHTRLFRPPYGNIDEDQIKWLASQQYHVINWNVDSLDWKGLNADQVATNVLSHVNPGSIVLQHGAGGTGEDLSGTVKALPTIIERLQARGIKLVTIPELLQIPAGL